MTTRNFICLGLWLLITVIVSGQGVPTSGASVNGVAPATENARLTATPNRNNSVLTRSTSSLSADAPVVALTTNPASAVPGQTIQLTVSASSSSGLNEIGIELCDASGNPVVNMGNVAASGPSAQQSFYWQPPSPGTYIFVGYAWNQNRSALIRTAPKSIIIGDYPPIQVTLTPSATTVILGQSVTFQVSATSVGGLNEIGLELCDTAGNPVTNLGGVAASGTSANQSFVWQSASVGFFKFVAYAWNFNRSVLTRTTVKTVEVRDYVPQVTFSPSATDILSGQSVTFQVSATSTGGLNEIGLELCDANGNPVTNLGNSAVSGASVQQAFTWQSSSAGIFKFVAYAWNINRSVLTRTGVISITVTSSGTPPSENSDYAVSYEYNNRGQLTAIKKGDGTPLAKFGYGKDGARSSRWLNNETRTDYGYDAAGRATSLNHYRTANGSVIQRQDYGYDLRDRRIWTQRNQALGDTYGYQPDGQLTDFKFNANNPSSTPSSWNSRQTFAYDAVGNRTSVTVNGLATNYSTNHANQYSSITGINIAHGDGRGNTTQLRDANYVYDADNRLISASRPGTTASFAYDPVGRLVKRTINGQTEFITYDGLRAFIRTTATGSLLSYTVWGPRRDEVLIDYTSQRGFFYYHADVQGNTIVITDSSRNILENYLYDAYGTVNYYDGNGVPRSQSAYGISFLFTGQEYIPQLGLYNYKNRFYSAELGRFLQSDPTGLSGGDINLYRYVHNNPFNSADPTGLSEIPGQDGDTTEMPTMVIKADRVAPNSEGRSLDDIRADINRMWAGRPEIVDQSMVETFYGGPEGLVQTRDPWTGKIATLYGVPGISDATGDFAEQLVGGKLINTALGAVGRIAGRAAESRTVIGRVKDLQNLGPGEKSLLDRLPNLGNPKANWKQNSGVLREEMKLSRPIRDASPGDTGGQFLNAERNLLRDRGWNFDPKTNLWIPPKG